MLNRIHMLCVEYKTLRRNGHLFVIYIQNLILRIKVCPFLSRDGIEWTLGLCLISHLFLYDFCQAPFSTTRPRETYSMFLNFFLIVKYLGGSFLMINERNMKVIFHLIWFPRLWLYVISIGAFFQATNNWTGNVSHYFDILLGLCNNY